MRIRLLIDIPVGKEHGLLKGCEFNTIECPKEYEHLQGEGVWVQSKIEPVRILPHEYQSIEDRNRVMLYDDWEKEGEKLFGKNKKFWRFKCVNCGHIQTIQDFIDHGISEPETLVFFSCLGRWVEGIGCDWTLGGLFQIHKLTVLDKDQKIPCFEFAENDK